jgi:hypothetical protein
VPFALVKNVVQIAFSTHGCCKAVSVSHCGSVECGAVKHWPGHTPTSFPGLSYEDEAKHGKALVWAGHVTIQKMAVFDSYSSRSGESIL